MAAPLTTYPGTVTPLRGLAPYVETERDVFFGRDQERDAVTRLVTQDGVRAALLFGEPGVGKTSLLRAGVGPHLRDHGVVALFADDLTRPTESFARTLAEATGQSIRPGDKAIDFLTRMVSQAMAGQLYVFVLDDVDAVLRVDHDGRIAHDLGDLFARVQTRSTGRARFLFAVADSRLGWLDGLERRTGSLFPPLNRYRLSRFSLNQAEGAIDKVLALAGLGTDPALPRALAEGLMDATGVLPAEVQLAARALRDLKLDSAAALGGAGGARALVPRWLRAQAAATGDEKQGLRVLGVLAEGAEPRPVSAAEAALRADVPPERAMNAFEGFQGAGIAVPAAMPDGTPAVQLAHELLMGRARELAAPAREAGERARALLGAAARMGAKLSARDRDVIADGHIVPASAAERAVLTGEKKKRYLIIGVAAAVPILLIVLLAVMNGGRYYLSTEGAGSQKRVVARDGRSGLSWFPGGGGVFADSGFAAAVVDPKAWRGAADHEVSGAKSDQAGGRAAYVEQALAGLRAPYGPLVRYVLAKPEDEGALDLLAQSAGGEAPEATRILALDLLAAVARGGTKEQELVGAALAAPAPAVQRAALRVALSSAARRPGSYAAVLGRALAAPDADLRAAALAGVRGLGPDTEAALLAAGLAANPEAAARRDLLAAFAALPQVGPAASADVAVALLGGPGGGKLDAATADEAWRMLEGAFARDAAAAARAAARLVGDSSADEGIRTRALGLVQDKAPAEANEAIATDVANAVDDGGAPKLAVAALPLYARVAPEAASRKLVSFNDPPPPLRAAIAAAWGELARSKAGADIAGGALEPMLDDPSLAVRSAAARAYGRLGRLAQDRLLKITKNDGGAFAEGAAWGLAASVEAGASAGEATVGIGQLWKKKGGAKREAARIYAYLGKVKPASVITYLASAARDTEDPALGPIGVDGLCNVIGAGSAKLALGPLRAVAEGESREAKQRIAACLALHPDLGEASGASAQRIALKFSEEGDAALRLGAAHALAGLAKDGKAGKGGGGALVKLVADGDRAVRLAAAAGLLHTGKDEARLAGALGVAWSRADEAEKLVLVEVAAAAGAGDLVMLAVRDGSARVRAAAVRAAGGLGKAALLPILGAALADGDAAVRAAALALVAAPGSGLDATGAAAALELAITGENPDAAEAALTALAGLDEPARVAARLGVLLASPSDAVRARAALAAGALSARGDAAAGKLLEPLLVDPSHDVRVAAVGSLAALWATTLAPAELGKRLSGAEANSLRRHVALAALVLQALRIADKAEAASAELGKLAGSAPPFAQLYAQLGVGLVAARADAAAFLAPLVP